MGAGAYNNFLGDVHGDVHQHIYPAQPIGAVPPSREEVLTLWARQSRNRLIDRWAAAGLDDAEAADLADDPTIGAPSRLLPVQDRGLVLLEGVFGSGKSVTAERLHQADLAAAARANNAPIPVYLDTRSVHGDLATAVIEASASIGSPEQLGVRLVLDGIDEVSLARATSLLTQARSLTCRWPGSRIVATARPGVPGVRDNERVGYPPMSDDEAAALAQRIGGQLNHVPVDSAAMREALRLPLFVIIAALSHRECRDVPSSRIDSLEDLVERALRRPGASITGVRTTLARLARLGIEAHGPVPTAEVGNDAEIEALVASRLVVRRGRTLAFGLPILEQYFGGKSLLEEGLPDGAAIDGAVLERWRYPLALAIASASWERSVALIQPIIDEFPGVGAWLIHESIPAHGRGSHASVPARCADWIYLTLAAWLAGLAPASGLLRVGSTRHTPPLVLAVHVKGDTVLTISRHTPTDDGRSGVLKMPQPPVDILAFRGRGGSYWHGQPAADYPAWPWRWSLDWATHQLAELLRGRRLHASLPGPAALERRWSQCRAVAQGTYLQERLSSAQIISRLRQILTQGSVSHRFPSGWTARRHDLEALLDSLEAGDGVAADSYLYCPYPAPDLPAALRTAHYGHYSNEQLIAFVEHLHVTAVGIYQSLCETWFPKLIPTLGLACLLPVRITGHVTRATERNFLYHEYSYDTCPVPAGDRTTAAFSYCEAGLPTEEWPATLQRFAEVQRTIEELHPAAAAWAHPRTGVGELPSVTDTPATDLAYRWLWEDLSDLRIVSGVGPR
ncbi:hypothetical protein ACFVYT_27005 [Streptomyces sp. NPDC058290]|uniref:hypothetical protein n=1 Tax=Streptomyces sp. NPDC058290 TaxID=3346426 RepID=UPI0036E56398